MIRALALTTMALATPAWADDVTDFTGTYRQDATAACSDFGAVDGALRIADEVFYGAGGQCRMTNPVEVRAMDATLFDFECASADAEWTARFFLSLAADDGLIVVSDGFAFKYDRCDPSDPIGAVTTAPIIGIEGDLVATEDNVAPATD